MSSVIRKTALAAMAALTLGAGVAATTSPAEAQWRRGGWHGGHGGWHGGHGGWGWGPGIVGGLAAGAIIGAATAPYWAGGYGYGYDSCYQWRPMYDGYGNYLGRRYVAVC